MTSVASSATVNSLHRLLCAVRWDFRLQLRYRILPVALGVTVLYCILFSFLPGEVNEHVLVPLVFSDPVTIGFLFVAVMVLFERGSGTLSAVLVSPLTTGEYLWAKAVSLSMIAGICSVPMAIAAHGAGPGLPLFWATAVLTALLLTFLGLAAVVRARSINAYLLLVPPCLLPLCVPLIGEFGLDSPVLWVFPTKSSLYLFDAALSGGSPLAGLGAAGYLVVATGGAFLFARRSFDRHVRRQGG
jgi:fluoroquinolone transport system permease protein